MSEKPAFVRYIRKAGAMEEHSNIPFMGATWYAANKYLAYSGNLPLSRLDVVDGSIIELPASEIEPVPRVFSKLKLCEKLQELGLWEGVKPIIEAEAGDYWSLAHDVSETHPKFAVLLEQLQPLLEAYNIDFDIMLDECIMERY